MPHEVAGFGIALSLAGFYFMLGSVGMLPMPETNGPAFLMFATGLAFLFAGVFCFIRAWPGLAGNDTRLPAYPMLAIGVFGAFATIGTWVAIGSGPRSFTMSIPLGAMQTVGDLLGRTVFGLGAVIVWICVITLTVGTVRKLFNRS